MNITKGKWEVKYEFNVFCGNRIIAPCGGHANNVDNERVRIENIANAHLIAAAPKMYDALVHIAEYWNGGSESAVDAIEEAITTAEEALAEARGDNASHRE